ncbi:MAG: PilZ domain-containing protein [Deltaproteobacteria bacterium]|nr:PilZ domain-containing protein [Deltaproteobacteria bacterium]
MGSPEDQIGKVRIISRLYELITSLTEEQQVSLLKQLFRDELPNYLFKMILDMPGNQQLKVIDRLEEMMKGEVFWDEEKITVVDIDTRRGHRKPCVILVDFSTDDLATQEFIRDISIGGAFIKTNQSLVVGQEIALSFSVPNLEKTFDLTGKVVRSNGEGIGVKFINLTKKQQDIMMSLIESMDEA